MKEQMKMIALFLMSAVTIVNAGGRTSGKEQDIVVVAPAGAAAAAAGTTPSSSLPDHNLRTNTRKTEVDCSKKAIRIYRFCIDGDHEGE